MKIKCDTNDTLFSRMIRNKRPICEKCRKRPSTQVHHFHGRRHQSVRFCEDNILALCFACHRWFHENPEEARQWMLNKLGTTKYEILLIKKIMYCKYDKKLVKLWIDKELKK